MLSDITSGNAAEDGNEFRIGAGISGILINGGVKLLDGNFQIFLRRFSTFQYKPEQRINNLKETFGKKQ